MRQGKHGTSRFPGEMRPRVLGVSDRAGFASVFAMAMDAMWPSALFDDVGTLEVKRLSRLNTRPMRPPVNASPSSLRKAGA